MKRPANLILNSVVLMLLAMGGALVVLRVAGYQLLSVQSSSMAPALHKGDLVVVKSAPHYQVGDVITFTNSQNNKTIITHRITEISRQGRTLQTKGDANSTSDKPISTRSVIGAVNYSIPGVGYAIDALRSPAGLLAIIYTPALWIVIGEVRRLAAYYESQTIYRLSIWKKRQKRRHIPNIAPVATATLGGIAIVVLAVVATPARAALPAAATLAGNTITSAFISRPIAVCNFPSDNSLLSYSPVDGFIPKQGLAPLSLGQTIQAGTYKVTATYADNHIANPNEPSQPNERWFAQLYAAGATNPTYTTGVTDDLPDTVDEGSTVIAHSLVIAEPVTGIRYVHNAANIGFEKEQFGNRRFDDLTPQEQRQVLWNSIHPKCLIFERLAQNP